MGKIKMLGALAGDIIGSVYEFANTKSTDFELFTPQSRFTDDSVMTLAVAKWLTEDRTHTLQHLISCMQELGHLHPDAGYGGRFLGWLYEDNPQPYNSWGNGAGMVFLAKEGKSKAEIKAYVEEAFGYDLNRTIEEIRPDYYFDVSCQGSVPEAIIAFLEGNSFEEVIRLAISLGGDSDTIGAMAGAIAACVYPIPEDIAKRCDDILTKDLREIKDKFLDMVEG